MRAVLALAVLIAPLGCGYTVRPPFDRSIKTVYVPIFKSQRFRRDLNLQLTEMLIKEIQDRTPYTVVSSPEGADARLDGVVTLDDKNVVVESPNNLPRQLSSYMICTVTFLDNRTGASSVKSTPPAMVGEIAQYFPEIGETSSLGFQKTMKKMVKDIVSMMENSWGDEYRVDIDAPPPGQSADATIPRARSPRR
jgi:hypothetical protein